MNHGVLEADEPVVVEQLLDQCGTSAGRPVVQPVGQARVMSEQMGGRDPCGVVNTVADVQPAAKLARQVTADGCIHVEVAAFPQLEHHRRDVQPNVAGQQERRVDRHRRTIDGCLTDRIGPSPRRVDAGRSHDDVTDTPTSRQPPDQGGESAHDLVADATWVGRRPWLT